MADSSTELDADRILASAARYLIDGGEEHAASVLLACRMSAWTSGDTWWHGDELHEGKQSALLDRMLAGGEPTQLARAHVPVQPERSGAGSQPSTGRVFAAVTAA